MQFVQGDDNGVYEEYNPLGKKDYNSRHQIGNKVRGMGIVILMVDMIVAGITISLVTNFNVTLGWLIGIAEIITGFSVFFLFVGFGELINQTSDVNKNLEDIKMYLYDRDNE